MIKSLTLLFLLTISSAKLSNDPVSTLDLKKYGGTWYSLYSIPTRFDSGSRQTKAVYTLNKEGYYNVKTIYKKGSDAEWHTFNSKMFLADNKHNGKLKAQFIWPYKVDYWIIELPEDYSYVVVGHPDFDFLFIMSRKPSMDPKLYQEIVARCKARGYDVSKLKSQMHS